MKRCMVILMLLVVAVLSPKVTATVGQVWNSSADWQCATPQNTANTWLYGFKWEGEGDGITTSPLHLHTFSDAGGYQPWYHYYADWDFLGGTAVSNVHKNVGAVPVETFGAHWEAGQTTMWPTNGNATNPCFRWVAPEDGTYDLDVLFTGNTLGGPASYWLQTYVVANISGVSTILDQAILLDPYYNVAEPSEHSYNDYSGVSLVLSAGDSIDFLADDGGGTTGHCVGLDATITQVPEPATMLLLALGSVALLRKK